MWQRLRARYSELRRKRAFRWATDVLLVVAVLFAVSAWQTRGHVGGAAPAFDLSTMSGEQVSLASLKGKPTLLHFWAPWCGVCKTETGNVGWAKSIAGERANVVSVVSDFEGRGDVQAFMTEHGVDYPVLLDEAGVARAFRVKAYPTTYFLDAEGRVTGSAVGYTTTAGLLARLFF